MIVVFAKTFIGLVRIGGENRWTLYDFGTVALQSRTNSWSILYLSLGISPVLAAKPYLQGNT